MTTIWIYSTLEWRRLMLGPFGWVIAALLYFAAAALTFFDPGNIWLDPENTLGPDPASGGFAVLFNNTAMLGVLLTPILSIRMLNDEKDHEPGCLFYSAPLDNRAILLGKFLALCAYLILILSMLFLFPFSMIGYHRIEAGVFFSCWLGTVLLFCVYSAIGLVCAVYFSQLTIGAVVSLSILIGLWLLEWASPYFAGAAHDLVAYMNFDSHYYAFLLGEINSADILYFFCITAVVILPGLYHIKKRSIAKGAHPRRRGVYLGVLVLLIMVAWTGQRWQWHWDLTAGKHNSLSPVTIKTLATVQRPVRVTVFLSSQHPQLKFIKRLLARYQEQNRLLDIQYFYSDFFEVDLQTAGILSGEASLEYGRFKQRVQIIDEASLTRGLQRLLALEKRRIVFLRGHGERPLKGPDGRALTIFADAVKRSGFDFESQILSKSVVEEANLIIVASPNGKFPDSDIGLLKKYIDEGGHLFWMSEPGQSDGLEALAEDLGLNLVQGVMVDLSSVEITHDPATLYLDRFGDHPATERITFLQVPKAAAFEPESTLEWQYTPVLVSAEGSWAETGETEVPTRDEDDTPGPLPVGVSLVRPFGGPNQASESQLQKIVVLGDGDMFSNLYVHPNHIQFGLNILDWFNDLEKDAFMREPPPAAVWKFSKQQLRHLTWIHVILIPLGMVMLGSTHWLIRRRRSV